MNKQLYKSETRQEMFIGPKELKWQVIVLLIFLFAKKTDLVVIRWI